MSRKILLTTLAVFILNGFGYIYSQGTYRSHIITEEGYSVDETSSSLLESQEKKEHYNAYRTTWKKNRFRDTWFVTIGSGVQLLMAEDDSKGDFAKRLTYAPTISIGKYFSPIWGLRLNFTGGSLHGFNDGVAGTYRKWNKGSSHYNGTNYAPNIGYPVDVNFQTFDPQWTRRGFVDRGEIAQYSDGSYYWKPGLENKDLYMQHIRYAAVNLNFMFDFLTLIGDYNPDRAFEITPFGGVTYAHLFPHMGYEAHDVIGAI